MTGLRRSLLLSLLALSTACGESAVLGDVTIALCSDLTASANRVELIVSRPQGFGGRLPAGVTLEDFDGEGLEELVWLVPEPEGGWSSDVFVHVAEASGSEEIAARVRYDSDKIAVSDLSPIRKGLVVSVCSGGQDGGTPDGGDGDAGLDGGTPQDDVRVTNSAGESTFPSIVSTGTQRAIAWVDSRDGDNEIFFARLLANGSIDGSAVQVTSNTTDSGAPSLVWTGSEFGLAWHDAEDGNTEIYFVRISATGVVQGPPTQVTTTDTGDSVFPWLVYNDSGFAVAWEDSRDTTFEIYIAILSSLGAVTNEVQLTNTGTSIAASLVWTGGEYGLAWQDNSLDNDDEIFFARVGTAGIMTGTPSRVTNSPGRSGIPSLTYDGVGYGVAWEDARDGFSRIFFVRLTNLGVPIGSELAITATELFARSTQLLWTGADYALTWLDNEAGNTEVQFASMDAAGAQSGATVQVSSSGTSVQEPALTMQGTALTAVWSDMRDGDSEIYLQSPVP